MTHLVPFDIWESVSWHLSVESLLDLRAVSAILFSSDQLLTGVNVRPANIFAKSWMIHQFG